LFIAIVFSRYLSYYLFNSFPSSFFPFLSFSPSKSEAIRAQFLTAIAAFLGTFLGYQVERNENYENLLLALTSGGFLYIATVSMLPAIVRDEQKSQSWTEIVLQLIAFLLGIALMLLVLFFEEAEEGGDHGHQH
jgi:zinc transporter ZupT